VALYRAKHNGRGRVELFAVSPDPDLTFPATSASPDPT